MYIKACFILSHIYILGYTQIIKYFWNEFINNIAPVHFIVCFIKVL